MTEVVITAHGLAEAARRLRESEKIMRREFDAALRDAARPIIAAARRNAASTLPKRGGLAGRIAASTFKVTPLRGQFSGVRITVTGHDPRMDTQGRLRHPVYGTWRPIPSQHVRPGWFTTAARRGERTVRTRLNVAAEAVAKRLAG